MNARVLAAGGRDARACRLAAYLPAALANAFGAAVEVDVVVVDGPPQSAALAVAAALERRGGSAFVDSARLVVVARRDVLASLRGEVTFATRPLVDELVRAVDAARSPAPALRLRSMRLAFEGGAKVMGILNVTPDSFFDSGKYRALDAARARAAEMVAQGAALVDVGGRSYAAGSASVSEREERERVVPVVTALVRDRLGVPLSVDTVTSGVAEAALAAGAALVNDCSGLADLRLATLAARYDAGLVVMHLKGRLAEREREYRYSDAGAEISNVLAGCLERARAAGVAADALVVDPGLEFGKEPETDLEVLAHFGDLRSLGAPLLLAASRKSFIGRVFGGPARDLLVPSLAAAAAGVTAGANIVRAHDVAETVTLLRMLHAIDAARTPVRAEPA